MWIYFPRRTETSVKTATIQGLLELADIATSARASRLFRGMDKDIMKSLFRAVDYPS